MRKIVIPLFCIGLLCGCSDKAESSAGSASNEISVTENTTAIETNAATTTKTTTTSAETTTVPETIAETSAAVHQTIERKIEVDEDTFNAIVFVENGYHPGPYNIFDGTNYINYDNEICFLVDEVSKVPNDTLGPIADEDDLIAKSRDVFIATLGQDFIDRVEADHIERNGKMVAIIERSTPLYITQYYEEYDVWRIRPCLPSGKTEDGKTFDTIFDNPPFLIVKGDSGKIIGCRF